MSKGLLRDLALAEESGRNLLKRMREDKVRLDGYRKSARDLAAHVAEIYEPGLYSCVLPYNVVYVYEVYDDDSGKGIRRVDTKAD